MNVCPRAILTRRKREVEVVEGADFFEDETSDLHEDFLRASVSRTELPAR